MKLTEAVKKIQFDILEGEEDIVVYLVEEYNKSSSDEEFVYKQRHFLDKLDKIRIEQFIETIGESKRLYLSKYHHQF